MISAIIDKIILVVLIMTLVLTALAHGTVEPWSIAIFQLFGILLILLAGVKFFFDKKIELSVPMTALPLFALLALGIVQSIAWTTNDGRVNSLSTDVEATRQTVAVIFFVTIVFLLAANSFSSRERLHGLANFLVVYGLVMAVFALIQHFAWNGRFYWIRPNTQSTSPFGPFVNHNHFAGYIEMLIPLPLALAIIKSARAEARMFYLFAAAVMCIAVLTSLSRGGMISVAVSASVVIVWALNNQSSGKSQAKRSSSKLVGLVRNAVLVAVIIVGAGLGLLWVGPDRIAERINQSGISNNDQRSETFYESRGWILEDTLQMVRANPLLGIGLGAYETAYPIYRKEDRALRVRQAHNDYLQIIADCGIVGGLIAAWFIFTVFRTIRLGARSRDPFIAALALGSAGGIFAMMIHSLVDFNLQLPSNALMFLLLVAVVSNAAVLSSRQEVSYEPVRVDSEKLVRGRVTPAAMVR